jgi:outer membrane murein-binding lipoprotein Lpp
VIGVPGIIDVTIFMGTVALSQITPASGSELGAWLVSGAAAMFIVKLGLDIRNGFSSQIQSRVIADQPVQVEEAEGYVTEEECRQLHIAQSQRICEIDRRVGILEEDVKQTRADILEAGDERARRLHQRIDSLVENFGSKFEQVRADIGSLIGEIRRHP